MDIELDLAGVDRADGTDGNRFMGLLDLSAFKRTFIEGNRGKPLFLIRFERVQGLELKEFIAYLCDEIYAILDSNDIEFGFHLVDQTKSLLMGLSPYSRWTEQSFPNVDSAIGRFHDECVKKEAVEFDFGVARTQCNFISEADEIYQELFQSSAQNLKDNLTRWSWTFFNRANTYISGPQTDAMIQPTVVFDHRSRTYSVRGGEVFVGGGVYDSYSDLIADIPHDQDLNRIELLILEKLIIACERAPGLLKFNISPQSLIDTFASKDKVQRFNRLLMSRGLAPKCVRFELIEQPYEETKRTLKEVCADFFDFGLTFAADDFGVKSQSHQVVLDLGVMIKEFKLDPISFKFKVEEDQTKFLDNLAFIEYCKRLADNREATITAEAVEDYDTLCFLLERQVYQFQANIFCQKMPIQNYKEQFETMTNLPESALRDIISDKELSEIHRKTGNIFDTARKAGLFV